MKNDRRFSGFSLAEVIVATAVIALLSVSLLSYVSSAATLWRRSDQVVNFSGDTSAIFDLLRNYTQNSLAMTPSVGNKSNTPTFTVFVATGTPLGSYFIGTITLKLQVSPYDPSALVATYTAYSPAGTGKITWVSTSETTTQHVSLSRFIGTLTEHLATFTANRISSTAMEFYLRLESPILGEKYDAANATPSFEATATFFAPGAY
jgi:prepilin-type N-terminal cleavage/methylation domain-containing protein